VRRRSVSVCFATAPLSFGAHATPLLCCFSFTAAVFAQAEQVSNSASPTSTNQLYLTTEHSNCLQIHSLSCFLLNDIIQLAQSDPPTQIDQLY
jgi:hypothetical protein